MFLRWHYLIDICAGITLAVSGVLVSRLALRWDAKRERLFLARDRFGKKPLFLYESDGTLAFQGGISARRHDANPGRDLVAAALREEPGADATPSRAPVFGCPLWNEE